MLRFALLLLLFVFIARAFWRVVDGLVEGVTGRRRTGGVPQRGVQMVRDPVCGTYVVRDRALSLSDGRIEVFFCSAACRDQHRSPPSTRSAGSGSVSPGDQPTGTGRPESAGGRTA